MAYIPKSQPQPLEKYTREYTNEAGTISTWYYDKSISRRGPYKLEHKYTKE